MSKETALLFWFPELSYHSRAVMLVYRKSFPLTKKFIYKKVCILTCIICQLQQPFLLSNFNVCMWKTERRQSETETHMGKLLPLCKEWALFFYLVGPRNQSQVVRLGRASDFTY